MLLSVYPTHKDSLAFREEQNAVVICTGIPKTMKSPIGDFPTIVLIANPRFACVWIIHSVIP
jgi:hypothetical protein